jgi:hypothetical protein
LRRTLLHAVRPAFSSVEVRWSRARARTIFDPEFAAGLGGKESDRPSSRGRS